MMNRRGQSGWIVAFCVAVVLTGCSLTPVSSPTSTTTDAATPMPTNPSATATVEPTPEPLPPLVPGTDRGDMLMVQRAEDAALVSGAEPIRLTLARTGNRMSWFTAPPQKLSGEMSTEEALRTLGWRPSDDGRTAPLPVPRPNGLLSTASGDIAFTVQRANVRSDGTLVLDIRPFGEMPPTTESFGPVSLTLDGVPGVILVEERLSDDLLVRVTISGERNQQAIVQVITSAGEIVESAYLVGRKSVIDRWRDINEGATSWTDPVVTFARPGTMAPGSIRIAGDLIVDGVAAPLNRVIARWSQPIG
jgi:hypothetical protein